MRAALANVKLKTRNWNDSVDVVLYDGHDSGPAFAKLQVLSEELVLCRRGSSMIYINNVQSLSSYEPFGATICNVL